MPAIPFKTYLYAALLVLALSCAGYFAYHERSVEHAKDVAAATKAVAKVEKKDAAIEAQANTEIQHDVLIYKQAVAIPPVADIGVMCRHARRDPVPGTPSGGPGADASPVVGGPAAFDPSGAALTVGRDDDAQIAALQQVIRDMQAEMAAAAKAHR